VKRPPAGCQLYSYTCTSSQRRVAGTSRTAYVLDHNCTALYCSWPVLCTIRCRCTLAEGCWLCAVRCTVVCCVLCVAPFADCSGLCWLFWLWWLHSTHMCFRGACSGSMCQPDCLLATLVVIPTADYRITGCRSLLVQPASSCAQLESRHAARCCLVAVICERAVAESPRRLLEYCIR
jgi:hypothetical protein